jgi:hypothetical protein
MSDRTRKPTYPVPEGFSLHQSKSTKEWYFFNSLSAAKCWARDYDPKTKTFLRMQTGSSQNLNKLNASDSSASSAKIVAEIDVSATKAAAKRKSAGDQTRLNMSMGGGSEREEPMDVDVTVPTKRVRQSAPNGDGHGTIDVG